MATFYHERLITFGDTDAAGIVYTPRYANFCMEAAELWFRDVAKYDWYHITTELGLGSPVVSMEIDFFGPLVPGDLLTLAITVSRIGRSSITLDFSGSKNDGAEKIFTAKIVFCFTEQGKGAMAVPAQQRRNIDAFMAQ